jgi:protein phosphatase
MPESPSDYPDQVLPYLVLYPHRLHLPEVYGIYQDEEHPQTASTILLENVPLDQTGNLYPAIAQSWSQATAVRQVYWLWQLLQLWTPLQAQGVASSLLVANNIRVEGWRIRLCQLLQDQDILPPTDEPTAGQRPQLGLADLADLWCSWLDEAMPEVIDPLRTLCQQMQAEGTTLKQIANSLNHLLLQQAAQLPLRSHLLGKTDPGPERSHNEDSCFPIASGHQATADELYPYLAIVCDGIGGHEGGEVASQMAVQSLKLQIRALLSELAEQTEIVPPDVVTEQLEAIVRVVNNLIAAQNDAQGRESRRRMGTTLVMALQLPQRVMFEEASHTEESHAENGHELYLVNVGDSRAYWITPHYCHQLTVDDDVITREVRLGRSLYREALKRSDASSLTQAIGTRDAEFLHPTIQRFIVEEDGLLLLCSDGLSDRNRVEESWADYTADLFNGQRSLDTLATDWINLAREKNGHDNISVVLLRCRVSTPTLTLPVSDTVASPDSAWSPASRALLEHESEQEAAAVSSTTPAKGLRSQLSGTLWKLAVLLVLAGAIGLALWSQANPTGIQQFRERLFQKTPTPQ